jgi:hypothetical protein
VDLMNEEKHYLIGLHSKIFSTLNINITDNEYLNEFFFCNMQIDAIKFFSGSFGDYSLNDEILLDLV